MRILCGRSTSLSQRDQSARQGDTKTSIRMSDQGRSTSKAHKQRCGHLKRRDGWHATRARAPPQRGQGELLLPPKPPAPQGANGYIKQGRRAPGRWGLPG